MAADLTAATVAEALVRLGHYRVVAAQEAAAEGPPDGISGALLLSLGLRETGLRNVNNPTDTDHGCFQVSELYHLSWLRSQPGCPEGEWRAVAGHAADEVGYGPRYTPALAYALQMLKDAAAYAKRRGVPEAKRVGFAVAAYNAGLGGAWQGHLVGDVDRYTTGRDYSSWVMRHRLLVQHWLDAHPKWQPEG